MGPVLAHSPHGSGKEAVVVDIVVDVHMVASGIGFRFQGSGGGLDSAGVIVLHHRPKSVKVFSAVSFASANFLACSRR